MMLLNLTKKLFDTLPFHILDGDAILPGAPTVSAGIAASQTITHAAGPPTVAWNVTLKIAGRKIYYTWSAGETDTQGAAKGVAAINAQTTDLPVTAANVAGVITVTFKAAGTWGNDCTISVTYADGTTGTVVAAAANLAGGTLESSPATLLTNVQKTEYGKILLCTGNTSAALASATSDVGRVKTHIDTYATGRAALLQELVVGLTGTASAAKTGSAQHNYGPLQYVLMRAGLSLPCELGAAEVGARIREELLDPAANRIGMLYKATLYGPTDLNADKLTDPEIEDLLQSGITPVDYDSSGNPFPSRPITTYFKDGSANADDRILDTSRVAGTYAIARDFRSFLPAQFPGAKLSADLLPGEEPLPAGVIEVRDVKSACAGRMNYWTGRGVAMRDKWDAAVAGGAFVVRVNPTDKSQCDIVIPVGIVPPLAKFSLVVNHTGPN